MKGTGIYIFKKELCYSEEVLTPYRNGISDFCKTSLREAVDGYKKLGWGSSLDLPKYRCRRRDSPLKRSVTGA